MSLAMLISNIPFFKICLASSLVGSFLMLTAIAPFLYGGPVFNFTLGTNNCPAIEYPTGYVALQVGGGAELFEHFQVSGGYSWGVSYQVRTIKLDNYSAQPRGGFIQLAYFF